MQHVVIIVKVYTALTFPSAFPCNNCFNPPENPETGTIVIPVL